MDVKIAVMRRRAGPLVQNSTIRNQHERQNSVRPLPPPAGEDWEGGERARSILFQWPDGYGPDLTLKINSAGGGNFYANSPNDQLVASDVTLDLLHSSV